MKRKKGWPKYYFVQNEKLFTVSYSKTILEKRQNFYWCDLSGNHLGFSTKAKTAVSCHINFDRHVHTLQELGGTWFVWAVFMLVVWFEMLLCLWCTNTSMHVHTPVVQTCAAGWRPLLSVMCGNLSTRVLWLVCPLLSEICWMCHWLLYFTSALPHMIWQANWKMFLSKSTVIGKEGFLLAPSVLWVCMVWCSGLRTIALFSPFFDPFVILSWYPSLLVPV